MGEVTCALCRMTGRHSPRKQSKTEGKAQVEKKGFSPFRNASLQYPQVRKGGSNTKAHCSGTKPLPLTTEAAVWGCSQRQVLEKFRDLATVFHRQFCQLILAHSTRQSVCKKDIACILTASTGCVCSSRTASTMPDER